MFAWLLDLVIDYVSNIFEDLDQSWVENPQQPEYAQVAVTNTPVPPNNVIPTAAQNVVRTAQARGTQTAQAPGTAFDLTMEAVLGTGTAIIQSNIDATMQAFQTQWWATQTAQTTSTLTATPRAYMIYSTATPSLPTAVVVPLMTPVNITPGVEYLSNEFSCTRLYYWTSVGVGNLGADWFIRYTQSYKVIWTYYPGQENWYTIQRVVRTTESLSTIAINTVTGERFDFSLPSYVLTRRNEPQPELLVSDPLSFTIASRMEVNLNMPTSTVSISASGGISINIGVEAEAGGEIETSVTLPAQVREFTLYCELTIPSSALNAVAG